MDSTQSPDTFKKLNAQLGKNSKKNEYPYL